MSSEIIDCGKIIDLGEFHLLSIHMHLTRRLWRRTLQSRNC